MRADAEQTFVIITAGCLEKGAQVKQRRRQYGPLGQKQSNQQAADAAVAVEKGMDGFELVVRERDLYQRWQGTVMQECLPLLEASHHFGGWRGDIRRRRQRTARRTDPILGAAKLAGRGLTSTHAGHEFGVQLAD